MRGVNTEDALIYQPHIGISRCARGWLTLAYRQVNKGGIHQCRWPLLICCKRAWRDSAGQPNMTRLWRIWRKTGQKSKQEGITATWWCLIYSIALRFTLYDIHFCYTKTFCLTTMKKVRRIKSYFLKKARFSFYESVGLNLCSLEDKCNEGLNWFQLFYREDSFVSLTKKGRINITKTNISKYLYPLSVKG